MLVYAARQVSSVSLAGKTTTAVENEVLLWRGNTAARPTTVVTGADLAAGMLTLGVQRALFASSQLKKPQVGTVTIGTVFPVHDELLLSFTAQVRGVLDSKPTTGAYTVHAIVPIPAAATTTNTNPITFVAPCPALCLVQPSSSSCAGICNVGLDQALALGAKGTFVQLLVDQPQQQGSSSSYLYLPSAVLSDLTYNQNYYNLKAQIVQLHPYQGLLVVQQPQQPQALLAATMGLADDSGTLGLLGSWTRAQVFSMLPIALDQKPVRDAWAHLPSSSSSSSTTTKKTMMTISRWLFFQQTPPPLSGGGGGASTSTTAAVSQWLAEVRPVRGAGGWRYAAFRSQTTTGTAAVSVHCTYLSCTACPTAQLRLLCHQAQDCVLGQCVGTVIQTRNVLCGVGSVLESTSKHAILTWRALHLACAEMALLVMRGVGGSDLVRAAVLRFPTEGFYSMLCSCKGTFASMIGLGVSVGSLLTSSLSGGTGVALDVSGGAADAIGALAGDGILRSTALAGLLFNAVSSSTLLPTMALHRWLLCIANASALTASSDEGSFTIQFGDASMDPSWLPCASLDGLHGVLGSGNMAAASQNVVSMFVQYIVTLASGIGETVLYGMQLSFVATIDYMLGLVWNVQDVLTTYNLRQCKVPNYAMRYVMRCACGDTAYTIPQPQRGETWSDGAFWCVGTLSLLLTDGTTALVHNPYSLDQLSAGVAGVTGYITCLSANSDPNACPPPPGETTALEALVAQSADPIAVWGRCKANYAMGAWDIGAGALFQPEVQSGANAPQVAAAIAWASSAVSPQFLACMQDPGRLRVDYGACMRLFFDAVRQQTPNAYFLYDAQPPPSAASAASAAAAATMEPPDACLVFSGLQGSSSAGTPLRALMDDCSLQENVGAPTACDLNPLVRAVVVVAASSCCAAVVGVGVGGCFLAVCCGGGDNTHRRRTGGSGRRSRCPRGPAWPGACAAGSRSGCRGRGRPPSAAAYMMSQSCVCACVRP